MRLIQLGAAIAAGLGLVLSAGAPADAAKARKGAKSCVMAGGQGTGLGQEIAKTMASAALSQVLSKGGMKGSGKVTTKCDNNPIVTTCTASQRACK